MFLYKIKYFKRQKGASAVEFALIFPILIILVFGIFWVGIVYNNYIALTHAAREGVRLAAVAEDKTFIEEEIIKRAPTVEIETITIDGLYGKVGMPVTVNVTGKVINIEIPFLASKSILLTSSATLRIENEKE
jgi:Flp pilus assembly protein TadG